MQLISALTSFLRDRVNLDERRIDRLDGHVSAVRSFLSTGSGEIADNFVSLTPQGSYAQSTIIQPVSDNDEFDADVLLELEEVEDWEAKDYVEAVYDRFRESGNYKNKVRRRTRCVVIEYAGDFHMDVVPYVERGAEHYVTNRRENLYERTNPEAFNEWLEAQDRVTGGNLVKVIRLAKYLRDFKNTFTCPSVILTILLADRVSSVQLWSDEGYYKNVPTSLLHVVEDLSEYLDLHPTMPMIQDPGCPGESFNHRWNQSLYENFRKQIKTYAEWIRDAYDEVERESSYSKWRKVFGNEFGNAIAKASLSASSFASHSASPSGQTLEANFNIPVDLNPKRSVHMVGRVRGAGTRRPYDLPTRGNMVEKGRVIDFSIRHCDVEPPYEVYWKVQNGGQEALEAGQLRGEITRATGSSSRHESTSFLGRHFVEIYVVKDQRCVARDRQAVVVKR
ncbi:SMODS domain-containing nucleotidyltransferase [Curtobacterium aurantiacum]|uniref:SMODS domain-containing nucleotidyltransferase n=1 Tax=Curtobacterium aurantiacum TaxID=3236919 RepID=UPI0027DFD17F|nr:nucleotidyltransferase [Curtobacterium flaccumfaciens]